MTADIVVIAWDGWLSIAVSVVLVALMVWNYGEARLHRRQRQQLTKDKVITATLDDGRRAVVLFADDPREDDA